MNLYMTQSRSRSKTRALVRPCLSLLAPSLLSAAMLAAAPLGAQTTISGTVVETETGVPVEGATVILLDRTGEQVAWRLTDAAGHFGFATTVAGTYSLRTDRIGHARVVSDPFTLERGASVVRRLETPVEAIMLAGIEVESRRRCEVRPGQGLATATVWEEARKALEATSRTGELDIYRFVIRRYARELDAQGRQVRSEQNRIVRMEGGASPFVSEDIEDLLANGFARDEERGGVFFAPDADVLLSDPFLDTHCMSLTEGEDEAEGLLGLSFEPTEDRGVPDISGVLWVDPANAELQWLEYGYEFLDIPGADRLGGTIRFDGLPGGTWIVREWNIRMPIVESRVRRIGFTPRLELVGLREEGGSVMRLSSERDDVVLASEAGTIEGLVVDSERSNPMGDVVVLLDDSAGVRTDRDGRFQFATLAEGYYGLRVLNPVLDSLGFVADLAFLEVNPGEVTSVRLRSVSLDGVDALMTEMCQYMRSEYDGILGGFARLDTGEAALEGEISVRWREAAAATSGRPDLMLWTDPLTTTDFTEDGFFLLCGVPQDREVEISAERSGVWSEPEIIRLSETQRFSRRDVTVPGGR